MIDDTFNIELDVKAFVEIVEARSVEIVTVLVKSP
jgi:hypothetical protein